MSRGAAMALVGLALVGEAGAAAARSCPSYTRGTSDGTHHCGVDAVPGKNPTTAEWKAMFALVAQGPKRWGSRGPAVADLKSGCSQPKNVPASFPCEIIKAIAQKESNWFQFCSPTEPASQRNAPAQTLIARDCGYGVGQVTTGMAEGKSASFDRDRVASDPLYNMAAGAALLADKWRSAACVENRDPGVIEDWYLAVWRYNGYSYTNDPSNPTFDSTRGVYNAAVGGAAPYQEKVFGIIETGSKNGALWTPVKLAYPRIEDVAGSRNTPVATMTCGSPTDCSQANQRSTHRSQCNLADADTLTPAATGPAGARPGGGAATPEPSPTPTPTPTPADSKGRGGCGCEVAAFDGSRSPLALGLVVAVTARRRRGGRT